jgi:hypothetical protein
LELEDFEQCEKQVSQLHKITDDVKEKDSIKIDLAILEIINQFLNKHECRWRPLKPSMQAFVKKFREDKAGSGIINYVQWIESKI